jgi:DNA-directed RNA polymerase subunit RPC12/RpoP
MGTIKSRPVYQKLRIDPAGRAHLIVTDLAALPEDAIGEHLAISNIESWVVGLSAPGIAIETPENTRAFRSVADLLWHLSHRLSRETMGLRLYAAGSEAFLWDVANLAKDAGLTGAEMFLNQAGTLRRRVYCSHCKTMNEDVETNIVACRGCGASLFVRDHFSRRLAAYMGVKVDAEMPGDVPAIEVLYP